MTPSNDPAEEFMGPIIWTRYSDQDLYDTVITAGEKILRIVSREESTDITQMACCALLYAFERIMEELNRRITHNESLMPPVSVLQLVQFHTMLNKLRQTKNALDQQYRDLINKLPHDNN